MWWLDDRVQHTTATFFQTSAIGHHLEGTGLMDDVLLQDSGYANSQFLMTPYFNPKTYQEEHFNPAHRVT